MWSPSPLKASLLDLSFGFYLTPLLRLSSFFTVYGGQKFQKKVELFSWQVLLGCLYKVDGIGRKMPLLLGPWCCILC